MSISNSSLASEATDTGYDKDFIALLELLYGKGYLSEGGFESVEALLEGIDLNGKKVLDLGCGIGGPTVDLAKKYDIEIVGVDPEESMIEEAKRRLQDVEPSVQTRVSFIVMQDPLHLKQFQDDEFDIIISKEAFLHVPVSDKPSYLQEVLRVLKPSGVFVLADWVKGKELSDDTQKMMEMDGLAFNLVALDNCESLFSDAGFREITIKNITSKYIVFCDHDIDRIDELEDAIRKRFGDDTFSYAAESWRLQKNAFTREEIHVVKIIAVKPSKS